MTLLQYTVPSTQGSFSLHTEHINKSLLRGRIITNCVVFAIINFQLFFVKFPFSCSVLQLHAYLSIMLCFVYLKQSLLLPTSNCFPSLLSLTASKWTCISWLQL